MMECILRKSAFLVRKLPQVRSLQDIYARKAGFLRLKAGGGGSGPGRGAAFTSEEDSGGVGGSKF